MMKRVPLLVIVGIWVIFGGIQNHASGGGNMKVTSSVLKEGGKIPIQYVMVAAGGKNSSVPLSWSDVPQGTKSFALSMVDPHPVAQNWIHWLVINLPRTANSLEEGASGKKMPVGAMELKNSFGEIGYGGPQPPKGTGEHPYVFTLYALSVEKLDLGVNTPLGTFQKAMAGKILGSASLTGKYER